METNVAPVRTFEEIASICNTSATTCFYAVTKYIERGNRFEDRRQYNFGPSLKQFDININENLKHKIFNFILSKIEPGGQWTDKSLEEQCRLLKVEMGYSIQPKVLQKVIIKLWHKMPQQPNNK